MKLQREWLKDDFLSENAVNAAKNLGEKIAPENKDDKRAMKTSQLRRFYGALKKIEAKYAWDNGQFNALEVLFLRPRIAYAVGRAGEGNRIRAFSDAIKDCLAPNLNWKEFRNLCLWLEAVVAYHKLNKGE